LSDFIEGYLTAHHRDNLGGGCVLAALGADVARQSERVRSTFAEGLDEILEQIAKVVPGRSGATPRQRAIAIIAELIGGLILARAVDDDAFSTEILTAASRDLSGVEADGSLEGT
jgi:TetR/AcrR family transcriptional repressor of nem operon